MKPNQQTLPHMLSTGSVEMKKNTFNKAPALLMSIKKKHVKSAALRNRIKRVFRHFCQINHLRIYVKTIQKMSKNDVALHLSLAKTMLLNNLPK